MASKNNRSPIAPGSTQRRAYRAASNRRGAASGRRFPDTPPRRNGMPQRDVDLWSRVPKGEGGSRGYWDEMRVRYGAPSGGSAPWAMRFLVAVVIVSVLAVAIAVLYYSNLFPVADVEVAGAEHLTQQEVVASAALPADATMLRIDTGDIEHNLEQSGWVRSASVTRSWPHTLKITITEREVAAVVTITSTENQQDEDWIIDSDGTWLMMLPKADSEEAAAIPEQVYEDADKVLRITNVPYGAQPVAGTKCTDDAVVNALDIVAGLTTSLADSIVQVSATDAVNTTLTLDNGVEIAFGKAEDIRLKERVCLELMEQHPDEIAYINVRVADRPTWRSL